MTEDFKDILNEDSGDQSDLDKILGVEFLDEATSKNEGKVAEKPVEEPKPTPIHETEDHEEEIPSLRGEGYPSDYKGMADRVIWQYKMLPRLDYDAIYQELAELSIKCQPTPTLQVLNDEIQKVQGAKDRVAEIFIDVIKCYNFKKRAVDIAHHAESGLKLLLINLMISPMVWGERRIWRQSEDLLML